MESARKPSDKTPKSEKILALLKTRGKEGCARGEIVRELNLSVNEASSAFKKLSQAGECFTTDERRAGSIVYFAAEAFPEMSKEEIARLREESPRKKLMAVGKTFQEKGEAFTYGALKELTGASQSAIYDYINLTLKEGSAERVRTGVYRFKRSKGETESAGETSEEATSPQSPNEPKPETGEAPDENHLKAWKEGFAAGFKAGWFEKGNHDK